MPCLQRASLPLPPAVGEGHGTLHPEGGGEPWEGLRQWNKVSLLSVPWHLQNQLAACTRALESSEELLETANQTLQATDRGDFPQVGASGARLVGLPDKIQDPQIHLHFRSTTSNFLV